LTDTGASNGFPDQRLCPVIEAVSAGAERHHLQQTTGDREVLQQMDHLILVAHGVVVPEVFGLMVFMLFPFEV
jgi:hypothetical protein